MELKVGEQREAYNTPLDPKDRTFNIKTINDVPANERSNYLKGIRGFKRKFDRFEDVRPIRYITETEASYLTNNSPPSITEVIMEPIAKSLYRYPTQDYLNKLEEVIIVAVPDEERSAYPSYDPLW